MCYTYELDFIPHKTKQLFPGNGIVLQDATLTWSQLINPLDFKEALFKYMFTVMLICLVENTS